MRVSAGQGLDALYDGVDTTVPPWPMTAQGGTGWEGLDAGEDGKGEYQEPVTDVVSNEVSTFAGFAVRCTRPNARPGVVFTVTCGQRELPSTVTFMPAGHGYRGAHVVGQHGSTVEIPASVASFGDSAGIDGDGDHGDHGGGGYPWRPVWWVGAWLAGCEGCQGEQGKDDASHGVPFGEGVSDDRLARCPIGGQESARHDPVVERFHGDLEITSNRVSVIHVNRRIESAEQLANVGKGGVGVHYLTGQCWSRVAASQGLILIGVA